MLWVEEGRLKCSAPVGAVDAEMRAALARMKEEIVTVLRQAEVINSSGAIIPIKANGRKPPIFVVSGHGGDAFCLVALARQLDEDQPVLAVQPPGLDGSSAPLRSVEALARYEIDHIRRYQPCGPYFIAGHCAGGTIAFEVAQQLTAARQQVALLALIGSPYPTTFRRVPQILQRIGSHIRGLTSGSLADRQRYFVEHLHRRLGTAEATVGVTPAMLKPRQRVEMATMAAVRSYTPQFYPGQIDMFNAGDRWHQSSLWLRVAKAGREHSLGGFEINDLLLGQHVAVLAASLQETLRLV
jgi:thioesterase domain-containing protein